MTDGPEALSLIDHAIELRRAVLAMAPDQAILQRELAIALTQRAQFGEHPESLAEAAVLLKGLHDRGALEAQYHQLAERLAPLAEAARSDSNTGEPT